jgi:tRNA pseudouridine38-40 synthase
MRRAAPFLLGKHDFQSFAANPGYAKESTVRTLSRCDLRKSGPLLTFILEGDGFLYKMCRGIVGTLVQVGLGKFPAAELKQILAKKDRRVAGMTAPAHGLVLWRVFYGTPSRRREAAGIEKSEVPSAATARLPGGPPKPELEI